MSTYLISLDNNSKYSGRKRNVTDMTAAAILPPNGHAMTADVTENEYRRRSGGGRHTIVTRNAKGTVIKNVNVKRIVTAREGAIKGKRKMGGIEIGKGGRIRKRKRLSEGMDFGTQSGMPWCWRRGYRKERNGEDTTSILTRDLRYVILLNSYETFMFKTL